MIINKNTIYNTKNYSGYNNESGTQIRDSIENVFFLSDNEISKNDLIQPPFLHKIVISNVTGVLHSDEKIVFDINQQLSAMQDYIFDKTIRKATKDGNYFITIHSGTKIKYNIVEKPEDTLEGFYLSLLTNFYIESSDLTGEFSPDQYRIDFYITLKSSQSIYFSDDVHVNGNVIVETLDNANINLKTLNNTEINLGSSNKSNIYIDSLNNSSIIINNQIKKDSNINIKQAFDCANLNKIQGTYSNDYAISFGTKNNPIDKNHLYIIKIVDAAGTFVLGSIFFFDENLSSGIKTANNIYTNSGNNQYIVMVKALANSIPTTDWSNADGLYVYVAYVNHSDMYMDSQHLAVQISNLKLSHEKSCIMQVPMNFNINNYGLE